MEDVVRKRTGDAILLVGILLIASTLRAPITTVGPVLETIRETSGISGSAAGILAALPVLAFAAVSPLAAISARDYGIERSLFGALLLILAGIGLRSVGPIWTLFLGTGIFGAGIAVGNVLLPSLLKRDFPNHITGLTGAYIVTTGMAGAVASATVVPLAHLSGSSWQLALASVSIFPLAAIIAWLPQLRLHSPPVIQAALPAVDRKVWHSPLAWYVTAFLGLTSLVFYALIGWLPAILADSGYSSDAAGSLQGLLQLMTAVPGVILGPLVRRMKDQRALAVCVSMAASLSLVGLWMFPALAMLWIAFLGVCLGATFILSLAFVGLRASHSHQAAALSGMAQSIGYSVAAAGPPLVGAAHDVTGGWNGALVLCVVTTLLMALFGSLAGRATTI